ncbi:MAG: hypothetical protein M3396_03470 [Actinomycetota bacterium]|nr:hypothetical protein [Actinomycetota bacterium]MDQ3574144.1 hypothetical protein [Actinomycetota bacterium]
MVHEGLLEYELVEIGHQGAQVLAVTLLRSTGMLSRVEMANRALPAGPPLPVEGAQLLGPVEARYALVVGDADPYALVDHAFLPLRVLATEGGGQRAATGSALAVEGGEVSALRRRSDGWEVRVFNPSSEPTTVQLPGRSGWLVDLRGRPLEPFDGSFPLRPWAIATARVSSAPST